MSFTHYDDAPRRDICSPSNHVIPSRDFRQHQPHGAGVGTVQPYRAPERPADNALFSAMKPTAGSFVDRLSYMPMSTTSGFVGPDPTSGLPYPFYNFDAMPAAASLSGSIGGGGGNAPPPEVDFQAMTSADGYSMASDVRGGPRRYATDLRPSAMTTASGFLQSPNRTPYVNGGTVLPVSLSSAAAEQQMSPPSATTPTSPTAIVYPWMTIVGQSV